jgi:multiple PDZ domain protein
MDPTQPHLVEVTRNATGSLGINLGQIEGGAGGVTINGISPACQSMTKGRLNPGDRILEVNGIDLRNASQADAIAIIMKAGNPVHLLVQSYAVSMPATPPTATANKRKIHSSPLHSNDGSWAIDEEEDEELRQLYPNANGHLYQVTLKKSPGGGLGLSICRINPSPGSGVCIMQIQPGGIADQTRKIKVGDELIQVNDHCIAGLSQQDVSDLLSQASLHVTLTLIRPFPDPIGPPQSQQGPPSVRSHPSPHPSPQVIEQQKYQSAPVDMLSGLPLVKAITIERDDNLGLGFTVSKTETASGTTGIIVTNITPNGPAEKEGQLQIGDSVISIDGHKVLGDKYEKATHLLQQARCNGSVSLIVTANKSQLPSQLKERLEKSPKKRNMGDKRMRVRSEGVTLRNKVTKTQLSTRRRPVSVDCDINYDNLKELTDVSKINSQLLQQKNQAAVPSPNKVNTMTQAEMMKDVDLYTTSTTEQDVIVGKPTDIEIFCGNQPLGVVLAKEMNSYQSNMFIHKIQGKSPAALDGRLKPNDVILSICDQPLENLSRDQAYQLLLDAPPLVKMSIYRRPSDKGRKEEGHEIEVVELIKPEKGGLGLMIQGDQVDGGVIITEVVTLIMIN